MSQALDGACRSELSNALLAHCLELNCNFMIVLQVLDPSGVLHDESFLFCVLSLRFTTLIMSLGRPCVGSNHCFVPVQSLNFQTVVNVKCKKLQLMLLLLEFWLL